MRLDSVEMAHGNQYNDSTIDEYAQAIVCNRIKFEIDDDKIYEEDETSATQKERESTHYTYKIRKNGSNVLKQ